MKLPHRFDTYCYEGRKRVMEEKKNTEIFFLFIFLLSKRVKRSLNWFLLFREKRSSERRGRRRWKCHFCLCYCRKGWASHIFVHSNKQHKQRRREREDEEKSYYYSSLQRGKREGKRESGKILCYFSRFMYMISFGGQRQLLRSEKNLQFSRRKL